MENPRPPRLASRLLAWLSRSEDRPSVLGDYDETFADVVRDLGPAAGRRWYRSQVLRSLPMLLKGRICGSASMIKSYATIARRNILKHKGDSIINILGLALGLAVCSLIVLWVKSELGYDRFHARGDRIYGRCGMPGSGTTAGRALSSTSRSARPSSGNSRRSRRPSASGGKD